MTIIAGSLKDSNKRWLSSIPKELCDRLNLLLQETRAGKILKKLMKKLLL